MARLIQALSDCRDAQIHGGRLPRMQHPELAIVPRLLRARRHRPRRSRAAEERNELATFHCPMPPVLLTERIAHLSYGRRLLRGGISVPLMSESGLGCAKTPAVAPHVEISPGNCIPESQIILHTRGSMPCWR